MLTYILCCLRFWRVTNEYIRLGFGGTCSIRVVTLFSEVCMIEIRCKMFGIVLENTETKNNYFIQESDVTFEKIRDVMFSLIQEKSTEEWEAL